MLGDIDERKLRKIEGATSICTPRFVSLSLFFFLFISETVGIEYSNVRR